jgi:hypothetical protein
MIMEQSSGHLNQHTGLCKISVSLFDDFTTCEFVIVNFVTTFAKCSKVAENIKY